MEPPSTNETGGWVDQCGIKDERMIGYNPQASIPLKELHRLNPTVRIGGRGHEQDAGWSPEQRPIQRVNQFDFGRFIGRDFVVPDIRDRPFRPAYQVTVWGHRIHRRTFRR